MKKSRALYSLTVLVSLALLILTVGCHREIAPDVTSTPGGEAEAAPTGEGGTPDLIQTSIANATLAAEGTEEAPEVSPTVAEPTATVPPMPSPTVEAAEPSATPSPEEAAAPTTAPTTAASTTGQKVHVVQPGENLFRIALRYGTTVDALARANGIANPSRIYVGQKLVVDGGTPAPQPPSGGTTYVVKPGDNLFRIALRYNMSYLYLAQYNGISNPSHVYVGQTLRIPAR